MRLLSEKLSDQPESHSDKEKMAEFSVPTWMVLNGLERMGYRVVTSSSMITGYGKHDTRDFIWTLHKVDMDTSVSRIQPIQCMFSGERRLGGKLKVDEATYKKIYKCNKIVIFIYNSIFYICEKNIEYNVRACIVVSTKIILIFYLLIQRYHF